MKAATLTSPQEIWKRPLRVVQVAMPQPKPGQVLLRVRVCGVCRTDLHIVEGDLPPSRPGVIPGHQIVGEVVSGNAAGATERLPVGTRVGVSWMGGTDGTCRYCRLGLENLCDSPTFTGYTVDGGYAEYAVVRSDFTFPLRPGSPRFSHFFDSWKHTGAEGRRVQAARLLRAGLAVGD